MIAGDTMEATGLGDARMRQVESRFDLPERLFVAGAFVAPLSLFVVKSLTVYDFIIALIAVLLLAQGRRLEHLPKAVAISGWGFLIAALVSVFRATVPVEAFTQTAQFAFAWFVLLPVAMTLASSRRVLRWSVVMLLAGSLVSVVAAMLSPAAQGADRFLIFFSDNPNRLGYPTAYLVPFVMFFLPRVWRRGHRVLAVAVGGLLTYVGLWALAASGSRGATLATLVAVTVYVILRPSVGMRVSATRFVMTVAVTASVAFVLTRSGLFPIALDDRLVRTFDVADRATLVNDRASLAMAGLHAFSDSPFVGTGLDNFRYIATRYADGTTLQAPHNLWIQFLAQVGIVGAVAFACFVVFWFSSLLTAHRFAVDPRDRGLTWAFLASMAAVMTIFMTTPVLIDRHYWLMLGLGLAFQASPRREPDRTWGATA